MLQIWLQHNCSLPNSGNRARERGEMLLIRVIYSSVQVAVSVED